MDRSLYAVHAQLCKVFSNPTRLEILNLLRNHERSVTDLTQKLGLSQANVSQHLAIMKREGIVYARRNGQMVNYRLTSPKIIEAFDIIRDVLSEKLKRSETLAKRLQR